MDATPAPSRSDLLTQIWSICTTFTDEAISAATKKCKDLGFDTERGLIPLEESFINLSSARGILQDAIEKNKLGQLPISIQKDIVTNLEAISKSLQGLTEGIDEIVNLTNSVEHLNTSIWKYGLHNLSDQVLGYQRKLNQIKNIEVELSKATKELERTRKAAGDAHSAVSEIEQKKSEAIAAVSHLQQSNANADALLAEISGASTKTQALYNTVEQQEKQSGELTSSIKTSHNELSALAASIERFYSEVEEHRSKISRASEDAVSAVRASEASAKKLTDETTAEVNAGLDSLRKAEKALADQLTQQVNSHISETRDALVALRTQTTAEISQKQEILESDQSERLKNAESATAKAIEEANIRVKSMDQWLNQRSAETIEANDEKTRSLLQELDTLREQIREQIQQATGFRLFGAFQARQNDIVKSKTKWAYAILGLVVLSAGVTSWIAYEAQNYSVGSLAFWVKLSLAIPLAYAIAFCTVQYNRERLLEEEYAFKASISVSLNPYRDLIHAILEKDGAGDKARYVDFVIDSIRDVFTPPTDKVFDVAKKHPGMTEKTFKQVAEIIGTGVKAAK